MGSLILTLDDAKVHQLWVSIIPKKHQGSISKTPWKVAKLNRILAFQGIPISGATIPPPKNKTSITPKPSKSKLHSGGNNMLWFSKYRESFWSASSGSGGTKSALSPWWPPPNHQRQYARGKTGLPCKSELQLGLSQGGPTLQHCSNHSGLKLGRNHKNQMPDLPIIWSRSGSGYLVTFQGAIHGLFDCTVGVNAQNKKSGTNLWFL